LDCSSFSKCGFLPFFCEFKGDAGFSDFSVPLAAHDFEPEAGELRPLDWERMSWDACGGAVY